MDWSEKKNRFFFKEKPVRTLEELYRVDKDYVQSLAEKVETTYSHETNIVDTFKELDLVGYERVGRKKYVFLSSKGREFAEKLFQIQ